MKKMVLVVLFLLCVSATGFTETADPFMGDWVGTWEKSAKMNPGTLCAQVITLGKGLYQINLLPEFNMRSEPHCIVQTRMDNQGTLSFESGPYRGTIDQERFSGSAFFSKNKQGGFTLHKVQRLSPTLDAAPPKGAVVLFDGKNLDAWNLVGRNTIYHTMTWKIIDDYFEIFPEPPMNRLGLTLVSKQAYGDMKLHLEFRLPFLPEKRGQDRGNSGLIIEEFPFYEIQILDSYGLPGYNNECGGIYRVAPPKVNMCAPPLQWQTYDIEYRHARFDASGALLSHAWLTVDHNGKRIHNQQELPYPEGAIQARASRPASREPGRLKLQDHSHKVQFRNIWLVEVE
jgi:hypothetical protein